MSTTVPTMRDVVVSSSSGGILDSTRAAGATTTTTPCVMNDFLRDAVRLHRIVHVVRDESTTTTSEDDVDVPAIVRHLYALVTEGKRYHLAGIRNVPTPFLTSSGGRFLLRSVAASSSTDNAAAGEDGDGDDDKVYRELDETRAKEELTKYVQQEFAKPLGDSFDKEASPYKEFVEMLKRYPATKTEEETGDKVNKEEDDDKNNNNGTTTTAQKDPIVPSARDAILIPADDTRAVSDRIQEHELGNRVLFNMSSQLVTTYTTTSEKRVEAALAVMHSLDDAHLMVSNPLTPEGAEAEATVPPPSQKARFLVRRPQQPQQGDDDERSTWSVMDGVTAAFLLVCFVFEVYLEKDLHRTEITPSYPETPAGAAGPIDSPTDFDVLFGRGGLTNAHPGNKRFRDVIALHRPDYIRAIKMDKPSVARRIVRSIRRGTPPGRFLKKGDDGRWYDVGDRTAAEKTSQGLRERSNAEKRQRHALREALRIRKQDMTTEGTANNGTGTAEGGTAPKASTTTTTTTTTPLPMLNYVGTNLAVPLSLGMKETPRNNTVKRRKTEHGTAVSPDELNTEGLPPNAVDEDGNILVTDHDILCGRGGLTNHHKGNKRFRDIVALHRPDYVRAPKIQKPSVARVIVRAIRNGDPPGRFLRKDDKSGHWIDIGDKKAAEKTSQALREKTNEEREKVRKDPTGGPTADGAAATTTAATAAAMGLLPASATTEFLATAGAMMAGIPAAPNVVVADGAEDAKPAATAEEDESNLSPPADDGDGGEANKKEEVEDKNVVRDPTANLPRDEEEKQQSTEAMAVEAAVHEV